MRDIHISNEVVGPAKLALLAQLARARISVCVDNAANLAHISRAMAGAGVEVDVLVRSTWARAAAGVRRGHRAGPGAAGARPAGRQLRRPAGLSRLGPARRGREERARICRDAARIAASHAQLLRESGIACDTITGGGTGSVEFDAASGVYTELQAGSYAFMDGDYGANEWGGR